MNLNGMVVGAKPLPVIFLMGPTATGKTSIAAQLYDQFSIELVSVDAAQVYVDMNIGTAKPGADFLRDYPHHLINIRKFDSAYSAADFVRDGNRIINAVHGRGRIPLFVGGTMFYFNALEKGLSDLPSSDPVIRREIEAELDQKGISQMHQELMEIDSDLALKIQPQDRQRIQRGLEIYRLTGEQPSKSMNPSSGLGHPTIKLTLFCGRRSVLHKRIEQRFMAMLDSGLVEEVDGLWMNQKSAANLPSKRIVGYRQVLEYLQNKVSYSQMTENGITATRQLAKRQLTWLRQQSNLVWFDAEGKPPVDAISLYLRSSELMRLS